MKDILLIFLGAALSYLATQIAEKQKFEKIKREEKNSFILRTRLALQALNNAIEKLKDGYSYRNFFEIQRIDILDTQILDLQFIKSEIENLSPNQQEKLLILLSDVSLLAISTRNIENFSGRTDEIGEDKLFTNTKEHQRYFEKHRMEKVIDLVEMKRRIEHFINELM